MTTALDATETKINEIQSLYEKDAIEAIELQKQVNELSEQLEKKKETLREIAEGHKIEFLIKGLGKINISSPRAGSSKVVIKFNEEKLLQIPDLKTRLLEKGIIEEETKTIAAAKASVTIKPNV